MNKGFVLILVVFLGVFVYAYISKPKETVPVPEASPSKPPAPASKAASQPQQAIKPVVSSEVSKLALILNLNELSDGSAIEFHLSESMGESFTVTIEKGVISVKRGEAASKDLVIWVSRKAFYEILNSPNPSETIKKKVGTGEMSFTREASMITLYRKGYKRLVDTLGLL